MHLQNRRSSTSPFRSITRTDESWNKETMSREEAIVENNGKPSERGSTVRKHSYRDDGSLQAVPFEDSIEDKTGSDSVSVSPSQKRWVSQENSPLGNARKNLSDFSVPLSRSSKPGYNGSPPRQGRWGRKPKKGDGEDKSGDSSGLGTSTDNKKKRSSVPTPPKPLPIREGAIQTTRKKIEAGILGWMRYRVCCFDRFVQTHSSREKVVLSCGFGPKLKIYLNI